MYRFTKDKQKASPATCQAVFPLLPHSLIASLNDVQNKVRAVVTECD